MSQPESKLSRDIMDALRARGVFCFKVHGGPTMMAGLPDIIACVPADGCIPNSRDGWNHHIDRIGLFVGFETKLPEGDQPTAIQRHVHNKIRNAYGHVYVVRSVDDAVAVIAGCGVTDVPENP